ncbi:MAG: hypothetical protein IPJ67_05325 [Candidatus Moraniibacteriota bacterium]|nr:MAG: hypothetical protein IPJ67_05325 [Candidatus Moranbacteria bacterium]
MFVCGFFVFFFITTASSLKTETAIAAFGDIVQTKQNGANSVSSITVTLDSAATAGNLLVCTHFTGDGNSTAPSGFSEAVAVTDATNVDQGAIYYKIATGGETSITPGSGASDENAAVVIEIEGPFDASPLDQTATQAAASGTSAPSGTTGTTSQASEVAVAGITYRVNGPNVSAWSNSFTEQGDVGSTYLKGVAAATKTLTSTGTQSTTATIGSATYMGMIATFKAGSSASIEQEGFRWRADDGSESAASWLQLQDVNIVRSTGTNTRLRTLLNATGDPATAQYQLEYKKSTDSTYRKVLTANAFPTVASSNTTNGTTLSGGVALNMPSGITAGDLLVAFASNDNTGGTNMGISGWTQLFSQQYTGNVVSHAAWAKIAVGSDTATLTGASQDYAATVVRITGHGVSTISSDIKVGTAASTSNANPNPPSLDAGSSKKWLWLESFGAEDDDNTATYWSTNYTGVAQVESAQSTSSTMCSLAYRQNETQTENPGTMAMAASEEAVAQTIAIPPYDERILLSLSSNITASGENTTSQLTAPSGKSTSDFDAGRIQDDENPADTVDITTDDYTEMEWSLTATSSASASDIYQFRVTSNGTALTTYSVTPQWTIGTPITISGSSNIGDGTLVRVAYNGTLQDQMASVASSAWSIGSVATPGTDAIITVFSTDSDGDIADSSESTGVTKYSNSGNIASMVLNTNTLSIGSDQNLGITVTNLDQYDCTQDEDAMHQAASSTLAAQGSSCAGSSTNSYSGETVSILGSNTLTIGASETLTTENLSIESSGTLTSGGASTYTISGNWANSGTFTSSTSTVTFDAGGTGKTIDAGGTGATKAFYDVIFNNSSGGWTIQTSDMKVSRNLTMTNVSDWTLASGRTLEVGGTYSIVDAETSATTWTGSTLYLNSASAYTVGSKTQSVETYGTLQVGANTDIRLWNSSAATYTIDASGSLLSQDHANTNGDVYTWGDFHTGTNEYWSYATDFDGTSLSGGSERQVDVRVDPAGNVTVDSGDTLAAIGTSDNRTTVSRQSASNGYGIAIASGGTINANYTDFDYLDGATGLDIQSGSTVTSLNNTKFDNLVGTAGTADAFITVASTVIGSGTKTITDVQFDNTGSGAEFNVNRIGSDDTGYWDFDTSTGSFDGEAYDGKGGVNEDNPGMIRWDDSGGNTNPDAPASLTQKNGSDVAIAESAWTTSNTPKLGFTITDPDSDTVKYQVQVATDSGFSSLVLDYTHGSFSASGTVFTFIVGTYGGGSCSGTCPATLSDSATGYWWRVKAIDDNSAESTYVEFGVAGTMDFKVDATAPTGGTVYDGTSGDQDWNDGSLTQISGNWTGFNTDVSGLSKYEYAIRRKPDDFYWSVCSGAGAWQASANWCDNTTSTSFTQNTLNLSTGVTYYISVRTTDNAGNVATAADSNGQQVLPLLSFSLSGNTVAFNNLNTANSYTDTKTITTTTSTNASNGYTVKVYNTDALRAAGAPTVTIPDFSGTWSSPASWGGGIYGFGYTSSDTSVQGSNRFSGGTAFAAFTQTPPGDVVADHTDTVNGTTGAISNQQFTITYKVAASTDQDALYYQTSSIFIVTANY